MQGVRSLADGGGTTRDVEDFLRHLPASVDAEMGERTLPIKGYNRPCPMKLEFSTVQFDESRGTFVYVELRA